MSVYDDNADLYGDDVPAQPKPTRHTLDCRHQQLRYSAWIAQWPLSCRECGATGVLYHSGVYRHPDGSGEPPSEEACDKCVAADTGDGAQSLILGYCPRCHGAIDVGEFLDDLHVAIECPHCGWAGGAGADDHMPEVDCHCWE